MIVPQNVGGNTVFERAGDNYGVGRRVGAAGVGKAVPPVGALSGTTEAVTGHSPLCKRHR